MTSKPNAIFICGTDTNVGKTIVSAWLALHWQADYWKPVQSGLENGGDSEIVTQLAQVRCHTEKWRLQAPLSPHQAAINEGVYIDHTTVQLPSASRLIVEGAGGLLTPLSRTTCIADLIAHLDIPVLLVARSSLGTINHSCLTVEALRHRKLNLLGVIMVGAANLSNRQAIEHYGKTSVLAELPFFPSLSHQTLKRYPFTTQLRDMLPAPVKDH